MSREIKKETEITRLPKPVDIMECVFPFYRWKKKIKLLCYHSGSNVCNSVKLCPGRGSNPELCGPLVANAIF